jgi:hypothetical protein
MIGFIIIRHVNSERTNLLWQECYKCIRAFYDNPIVIIDDNSNSEFLTTLEMTNVTMIQSEYPRRAELLPYYYFLKEAWFDTAVILHDSVFIQAPIKFDKPNRYLWHFSSHQWDNREGELECILKLNNNTGLLDLYNSNEKWNGCFGVMSIVTYTMIHDINMKYNFFTLLDTIVSRKQRMMIERIFAVILTYESGLKKDACSYFGNIQTYCSWRFNENYSILDYFEDKKNKNISLPIVKLWSGR